MGMVLGQEGLLPKIFSQASSDAACTSACRLVDAAGAAADSSISWLMDFGGGGHWAPNSSSSAVGVSGTETPLEGACPASHATASRCTSSWVLPTISALSAPLFAPAWPCLCVF